MSSDDAVPLVMGGLGLAGIIYFSFRAAGIYRAARAAGRPAPKSLAVFWVAFAVAVVGYTVLVIATLLA